MNFFCRSFLFIFFALLFSTYVEANEASCTAQDFRSQLPPIRSSEGTNWCFAYAASDLVSQKLKTPVSAIDLAYGYVESEEKNSKEGILGALSRFFSSRDDIGDLYNGGFVDKAVNARQKVGYCLEKDLPSEDKSRHQGLIHLYADMRKMIEREGVSCLQKSVFQKQYPDITKKEAEKILAETDKDNVLASLAKNSCDKRVGASAKLEAESKAARKFANPNAYWSALDSQLSAGKVVSVGLSHMLTDPELKKSSSHAVTLVGRRWNPKKNSCEYLVRNSLDLNNCGYFQCEKDGHVWVTEQFLKGSVVSFTYLK